MKCESFVERFFIVTLDYLVVIKYLRNKISPLNKQVFIKLMRRYKYLEKMFEEEMKKVLVFMKGFSPEERIKLARMTALWISNGSVPPTVLSVLINEHLVKDNLALDFLLEVFVTWKQEKGLSSLTTALKKGGIEGR